MTPFEKVIMGAGTTVIGLGLAIVIAMLMAYPVKWCWNYSVAPIFDLREIGALQGWCLMFLCQAFFKASVTLKCKHDNE